MVNQGETTESKKTDIPVLILVTLIILSVVVPISLSFSWRQGVANECDGRTGSPSVREVQGPLQKFQVSYFIPGEKGNWIVFACGGKGGCTNPLKERYEAALGQTIRAGFCRNELLWTEIDNERAFTRDTSSGATFARLIGFALPVLIVILAAFFLPRR